jgi:hypothetical protein
MMRIREETGVDASTRLDRQQVILDAIAELEEMHRDGQLERPAYLIKKRALVKML